MINYVFLFKYRYKLVVADVVIEKLTPIRNQILRLIKEPAYLDEILREGTLRATELATSCWMEVTEKVFSADIIHDMRNRTHCKNHVEYNRLL